MIDSTSTSRPTGAIILAAGKGKRMNSDLPKVAHVVAGRPMIQWVVDAVREVSASPIVLVIGHGSDVIRDTFASDDADLVYAVQDEQLGTGHATTCAASAFENFDGDVFVLAGDGPLIRPSTLAAMLTLHQESSASATLATSIIADPTGYGRIVRDAEKRFERIVEHRNATDEQRAICEIYPSYACFDAKSLFAALRDLPRDEVSGEYYLTDVPEMLRTAGHRVEVTDTVPPEDVLSINTPDQLAEVEQILSARLEMSA